jgi:hypothetical protein
MAGAQVPKPDVRLPNSIAVLDKNPNRSSLQCDEKIVVQT